MEAVCIATLQRQISDKFLAKLAESKDVDVGKIAQLKNLWSPDGVLAKHRHRTRSSGNVLSFTYQLAFAATNAIAILGLNLIAGQAGLISLGHGAFYGVGAYTRSDTA